MENVASPSSLDGFSVGDRVVFRRYGKEVWVLQSINPQTDGKKSHAAIVCKEGRHRGAFLKDLKQVS